MDKQYTDLEELYSNKNCGYYDLERTEMLRFIPGNVRSVLEVGCSSGEFGKLIKDNRPGATVWGVESGQQR